MPFDRKDIDPTQAAATVSLAQLALTSFITTASGALVAVLSFLAQARPLPKHLEIQAQFAIGLLATTLVAGVIATFLAYFYQHTLTYGKDEYLWLRWSAIILLAVGLISLVVGGVYAAQIVTAVSLVAPSRG